MYINSKEEYLNNNDITVEVLENEVQTVNEKEKIKNKIL